MTDASAMVGATVALAQTVDPLSIFEKYGYPGLIILFLVVVWADSKLTERQNRLDQKERQKAEAERANALNTTLGDLKTLIGRLLERTEKGN